MAAVTAYSVSRQLPDGSRVICDYVISDLQAAWHRHEFAPTGEYVSAGPASSGELARLVAHDRPELRVVELTCAALALGHAAEEHGREAERRWMDVPAGLRSRVCMEGLTANRVRLSVLADLHDLGTEVRRTAACCLSADRDRAVCVHAAIASLVESVCRLEMELDASLSAEYPSRRRAAA